MLIESHHGEIGRGRVIGVTGNRILPVDGHLNFHGRFPRLGYTSRQAEHVTDVYGSMESERVDLGRDHPSLSVTHRRHPGRRIDQFHDRPTMNETGRVGVGDLHHLRHGGDRFRREFAVHHRPPHI